VRPGNLNKGGLECGLNAEAKTDVELICDQCEEALERGYVTILPVSIFREGCIAVIV